MLHIYALIDPFTFDIRYVGQAVDPKKRYYGHMGDATNTPRTEWIRFCLIRGRQPIMAILQYVDADEADRIEALWIKYLTLIGCPLLNRSLNDAVRGPALSLEIQNLIGEHRYEYLHLVLNQHPLRSLLRH